MLEIDGEAAFEFVRRGGRCWNGASIEWPRELRGARHGRDRSSPGRRGRAALARRRGEAVALPPGPDSGEEDGQRDDLLTGARGLHARQLHADPARPVGFGKFGKRGVGYNVDSLVSQIRKILRTAGKHNIALFGAGNLGQAIAGSDIFADHGFRVVALFDTIRPSRAAVSDPLTVRPYDDLDR